jgi:hypothetical protein
MATYRGVKIISAERLYNSVNGNPRWHIVFSGEPFAATTQSDAACNYEVSNFTHSRHRDDTFTITTSRAGRITRIELES